MHTTDETWLHLSTLCLTKQHPGRMWHQASPSTIQRTLQSFSELKKEPLVTPLLHCNIKNVSGFPPQWAQNVYVRIWNSSAIIYTVNSWNYCISMKTAPGTSYLLCIKSWPCFPCKFCLQPLTKKGKTRPQEGLIQLSGHQGISKVTSQTFRKTDTLSIAFLLALN